ncbi:TPR repeat-containing protein [Nostoc sp. HK-01]|nr:TPR repeat-containing protein [Nostoc sp. HK-01]
MSDGEWKNNKNTSPTSVPTTRLTPIKRNTITHEFAPSAADAMFAEDSDTQLWEASELLRQGMQQQQAGELIAALKSLQKSLELFEVIGDIQQQEQALSFLAVVTYASGDYKSTISYAQQCLTLKKETPDPSIQMQAFSHLGNAYRHLNDHNKAIKYLEECLKITRNLQDKRSQVAALNNLGLVYKAAGN